jgi:hypothetical protein
MLNGLVLALLLAAPAADTPSVAFNGPDGKTRTFTVADLAAMAPREIEATDPHPKTSARYTVVPLGTVLAAVGAPSGDAMRGKALAAYVTADARDGYRVVFGAAELDGGVRDADVFLAFRKDGQPIDDAQGPFRLVVPSDKRGARWVRQLARVTYVSAAP